VMLSACNMVGCLTCGISFLEEHALSCPRGEFLFVRHNEIRDSIAHLLRRFAMMFVLLQPLNGRGLSYRSAVKDDVARLDISAHGFGSMPLLIGHLPCHLAFIIMSSKRGGLMAMKGCDVEIGCFSPLVFSAGGGCGPTTNVVIKMWASCIAICKGSLIATPFLGILVFL